MAITASNASKSYRAALPALGVSYSGFAKGDTAATASNPTGTYAITANGAMDGNYTITYVPGRLTVTPAALTITADDKTRAFGITNPPLTAPITGFVAGETLPTSGVTGTAALSTSADTNSPPGSYPIMAAQGTLTAANYTFSFVDGTLTVTGSAPVITQQPANQTVNAGGNASFTVAADGTQPLSYQWLFGGAPLSGATSATLTLPNVSTIQAGVYAVTVSNIVGPVTSSNGVLTVNLPVTPPTLRTPTLAGRTFSVLAATEARGTHYLEFSDSLSNPNWTAVPSQSRPGNGGDLKFQDTNATGAARYYRVRVE